MHLSKPSHTKVLTEARPGYLHSMDSRHIQFRYTQVFSPNHLNQLCDLFKVAAFWAGERRPSEMARAIAHSKPVVTVWDSEQLIGFSRATSDGVFRATIWDVVIHPDYQGAGLGRRLVETLIAHPHMNKVERTYLMTTHQQSFYERIGFEQNSTTTMVLHNQLIAERLMQEVSLQEIGAQKEIEVGVERS